MKKYYLLKKLRTLQLKLNSCDIINSDLNILIMFGNELTYDTLLGLVDNISDIIKSQLLQKKAKTNDNQKKTA